MLIANMGDGSSRKFDLADPSQLAAFNTLGSDPSVASLVTGLWLKVDSHSLTVPTLRGFDKVSYHATLLQGGSGPTGEVLECRADDIEFVLTGYYGRPQALRLDLSRRRKQRWSPR